VLLAQAHFRHLQADGMLGAPVRRSDVRGSSAGPETDLALEREAATVRSSGRVGTRPGSLGGPIPGTRSQGQHRPRATW
jgi:hypothetical protein